MHAATLLAAGLLVAAGLANLPIVYALIAEGAVVPVVCLAFGFLAMGLAWGGGFLLEGKRRWFTLLVAALGALEAGLALVPEMAALGTHLRAYLGLAGALAAAALVVVLSRGRSRPAAG